MSGIESLNLLAEQFARLPGIGKKSAQRLAYALLEYSPEEIAAFAAAMTEAKEKIHRCPVCQNLTDLPLCPVCANGGRDRGVICVVEDARAVTAFERVRSFTGVYHVLHGVLSPLNDIGPDQLRIKELLHRISEEDVKEVIMATNPDTEGETTALYISRLLRPFNLKVTRLAYGVPVGGHLEFSDEVTLTRALEGRREL